MSKKSNPRRQAMAEQLVLRAARRSDIPAIDAMHFLSVQALTGPDYSPVQIEAFIAHLGTYDPALIDDGTYFVVEGEGLIVASGGWSQRSLQGGGTGGETVAGPHTLSPVSAKIRSIFVHPKFARLGLGTRVVRHAEAQAVAQGHRLLELWATLTGVPLYRKLDYQVLGRILIEAGNGAALPAVHMARLVCCESEGAEAA